MNFSGLYFLFLAIPITHLFYYQIRLFNSESSTICLKLFKSNNFFGLIILLNILLGKIY